MGIKENTEVLSLQNINKYYGDNHVLRDVSFNINKGEVVAIIGSSGGGKTTLLRTLLLLEQASSGSMTLNNQQVFANESVTVKPSKYLYNKFTQRENSNAITRSLVKLANGLGIRKRSRNSQTEPYTAKVSKYADSNQLKQFKMKMGLVFQDFNLFPHLTVLDNCTLAPTLALGMTKEDACELAKKTLDNVGLLDKISAYPSELSGGQKQRVAIARALCLNPEVLCFDEPTSALDPELVGEVVRVISQLKRSGVTMLIVTHQIMLARQIADKVIYIDNGTIVEMGTAADVIDNPKEERTKQFMAKILGD